MSARLAVASAAPEWCVPDCLSSVEQRCRKLINPSLSVDSGIADQSAAAEMAAGYHLQAGGRRIRARLALDASFRLGLTARTAVVLAATCELLHNASLVHDDLQDRDSTRRGVNTVWKNFGDNTAICTGDLLLSAAYASLAELDDLTYLPQMLALVHRRTAAAIQGQSADLAHRTSAVKNTDTYLKIVAGKSGAMLSLPIELALLAAGQGQWMDNACAAAEAFAIGYQIADDLDDIDKDAAPETAAQALNLALLIQQRDQSPLATVRQQCIAMARHHLNLATDGAALLPQQSGNLLAQLATELNSQW